MPSKLTYLEVKKYVESKGFTLLTKEYINSLQKLTIVCSTHGLQTVTFKWLKKGTGCFKCGQEVKVAHRRHSIEEVKKEVEKAGYSLLSTEYKNVEFPILLECSKHGKFESSYYFIKTGHGCRACGYERLGEKTRTSIEEIKEIVSRTAYKLISTQYLHHNQKIELECSFHGKFFLAINPLKNGRGCKKCGHIKGSNKRRTSYEDFIKKVDHFGYEFLSPYISANKTIKTKCPKHGEFDIRPNDLLNGHGCRYCGNSVSRPQINILNFLKSSRIKCLNDTRKIITPLELDIYIPSKNVAIEYCGLHWHSEIKKERNYHNKKRLLCEQKNIQLITIFEDEWLERESCVKNILKAKLSLLPKIAARKSQVKEITKKESDAFVDKYHLQGSTTASIYLGLFYENELIGVITGGPHHRQGQTDSFVLNRLCFGPYAVMGGASKLFKAFKEKVKSLNFSRIVSWSDNRWSNGGVYKQLDFILEEDMDIDYSYCKGQKRFSKQSCQKKHLLKKGAIGNTEKEMALSLDLLRIWDCGKKRWVFNLS